MYFFRLLHQFTPLYEEHGYAKHTRHKQYNYGQGKKNLQYKSPSTKK